MKTENVRTLIIVFQVILLVIQIVCSIPILVIPILMFMVIVLLLPSNTVKEVQELVSKGRAYDQVAWERDVALEQLEEIGLSFGQKTDDVRAAVERMKPKKPIILDRRFQNGDEICTEWKCPVCGLNVIEEPPCQEYCQRCGNKMDWTE